jgi:hypothetical protein
MEGLYYGALVYVGFGLVVVLARSLIEAVYLGRMLKEHGHEQEMPRVLAERYRHLLQMPMWKACLYVQLVGLVEFLAWPYYCCRSTEPKL